MTILWYINVKTAKIIEKNLQGDNYQVDLKEFETSPQENSGIKNFDNSWMPKCWRRTILQHIHRTSFLGQTKIL